MELIKHMLSHSVCCVLRSGRTIRRAGEIERLAGPGPSRQNPRTARHNRSRRSPDGLQMGLRQGLTPEETITLSTSEK